MRYTTTDGPDEPLNAIQDGSLGDKMGIAANRVSIYIAKYIDNFFIFYLSNKYVKWSCKFY